MKPAELMGEITGGGVLQNSRQIVRCPGCGRLVRAVAYGGRVRGWCAVHGRYVNALVEDIVDNATKTSGRK